ncbi:beta-ketoacyl synthase chain length factor [Agrilutibacter solisilvae]|uniref:Beta-ketoacyl synthase chain length factor n=1 Tax=Agrilutibacter solisilvae TaxID=2763317 RepID=A0A974Y638_9GAMM|nr:beta-ketoacyl synthase chain length factor [Lysobacter solisilvae]QSX79306.1 beta-ketoacyl synthase chain length factor [Lysobacter solisilvae]
MTAATTPLHATIEGIGFWAPGLPTWEAACRFVRDGELPADAPARPSPQLLAPNERRRAPETVAVALDVALAACRAAGREPAALPSVFASMHGDLAITDYMCATLAADPASVSPTRFHNSVHNAAAGYWTIGTGAMQPATALSAGDASFAQGLLDALAQLHSGSEAVLLVAYDSQACGPLAAVSPSVGVLGAALVLSLHPREGAATLELAQIAADATSAVADGPLARRLGGNAMAPMLPLFDALAQSATQASVHAGPGQHLQLRLVPAAAAIDAPTGAPA